MAGKGGGGAGGGGGRGAAKLAAEAALPAAGAAAEAGRQIEAFTLQPVLTEKRLLCLEAWGSYALLGLSGAVAQAGRWWHEQAAKDGCRVVRVKGGWGPARAACKSALWESCDARLAG